MSTQQQIFEQLNNLIQTKVEAPVRRKSDIVPRPYQQESIDSVFEKWETDQTTLVCLPTGCGKSIVFSKVMDRFRSENPTSRVMVIAHRKELIEQAQQHAINAGLTCGIEMGSETAGREAVIATSYQTQCSAAKCRDCRGQGCDFCEGIGKRLRMTKFDPRNFGLLVVDEAHHATSDSYRLLLQYYKQNKHLKILLVTATPKRGDGVGLHNVCDSVAYEMQLETAINDGWLVPVKPRIIHVDQLDLSKVKKSGKDLNAKDVARAFLGGSEADEIAEQKILHSIAKPTIEQANGKPVIAFAAGKEHAEKLTAAFNAYPDVTAECVIDSTHKTDRKRIIHRYKTGVTQVLVNCMVFTEGFDAPATAVIANTRSTKSEALLLQMIGRGTRPLPGIVDGPTTAEERRKAIAESDKPHCVVIDFVGTLGNNTITTSLDLLAGEDACPLDIKQALKEAAESDTEVDAEELLERLKAKREREEEEAAKEKEAAESRYYATNVEYSVDEISLFLKTKYSPDVHYKPTPQGPSEKQVKCLIALGFSPDNANKCTKRQASAVISGNYNKTNGNSVFTFGKHAGKKINQCPRKYVSWVAENLSGSIQEKCSEFLNPNEST